MYKYPIAWSSFSVAIFVIVISAVSYHGKSSRIFSPDRTALVVNSPEGVYNIWRGRNLKGRILLLFDNYPHSRGLAFYEGMKIPQLTRSNLIEVAIFNNIIRKIYYIVPDEGWEYFKNRRDIGSLRRVSGNERGLYLFAMSGIPLIAVTPASLPGISEETLVYINDSIFNTDKVLALMAQKEIKSDIVIAYQGPDQ